MLEILRELKFLQILTLSSVEQVRRSLNIQLWTVQQIKGLNIYLINLLRRKMILHKP